MNRFIRTVVFAMVILLYVAEVNLLSAQKTVTMYMLNQGRSGDTSYLELRSDGFQDVSSMEFSIRELNAKGSFYGIDRVSIPNFQAVSNYTFDGTILRVNWTSPIIGYHNPDGQVLFRIQWITSSIDTPCLEITGKAEVIKVLQGMIFDTNSITGHNSCETRIAIPSYFNAYIDANLNCSYDQEQLFNTFTIIDSFNQNKHIYKNPQFLIYGKADYGRHHFIVQPEYPVWTACNLTQMVDIDSTTQLINLNYGMQALISCPQLVVEIFAPIVRRCVDFKYLVKYSNSGTIPEDSARVRIKLDPYMSFISSSIPPVSIQLPYVEFSLGQLKVYQKGEFDITVNIDCNSTITGQTHCVTAEILPHYNCFTSPSWSRASIKLDAKCEDGKAKFRITNAGTGDMAELTHSWIVEDDIGPGLKKDIRLNINEYTDLEYPANGKSYRLFIDQVKNHPGHSNPTVALEACGRDSAGNFSTGYLLMFPEDEEDPDVSIDCQASRASFDPNDKTGIPVGYGAERYIEPGRTLEYKIRFQNTGNDTAYKVIITDTLSEWLDLKSIRILGASHPFQFNLVDRVLRFHFEPVSLPYQAIDEEGSMGFVIYSLQPKPETPLQTVIPNHADIYFDFNAPVRTNTTIHTLATDFIIVSVVPADPENTIVNIYPNPGTDALVIESDVLTPEKELVISDLHGRKVMCEKLYGKLCKVNLENGFTTGIYIIEIRDMQNRSVKRKIMVSTKK